MTLIARRLAAIALIACAVPTEPARADRIGAAQDRLDAANAAAKHHQAAAAEAARAEVAARYRKAKLVKQEIAANAKLRDLENQTAAIASRLADLQVQEKAAKAELDADSAAVAPLLPLITRLALHPAATLIATGSAPGEAAIGALAMKGITRRIGERARALRAAQRRYATISANLVSQTAEMQAAVARQQLGDAHLKAAIAAVAETESKAASRRADEARTAQAEAGRARSIAGMIERLQRQKKAQEQEAAARLSVGLPKSLKGAPVAGKLVRAFASATSAGPSTGDTFAAAPGAVVSAACSGEVVFARPFASYGKLMILDCGHGYDFVMAGFDRFDVSVGQQVQAGQPVGRVPRFDPHNPGNQPRLYVELRHHGKAIDPAGHFGIGAAGR